MADRDAGIGVPQLVCTHRVRNLANGTWDFTVTAFDEAGAESDLSNEASKIISCP